MAGTFRPNGAPTRRPNVVHYHIEDSDDESRPTRSVVTRQAGGGAARAAATRGRAAARTRPTTARRGGAAAAGGTIRRGGLSGSTRTRPIYGGRQAQMVQMVTTGSRPAAAAGHSYRVMRRPAVNAEDAANRTIELSDGSDEDGADGDQDDETSSSEEEEEEEEDRELDAYDLEDSFIDDYSISIMGRRVPSRRHRLGYRLSRPLLNDEDSDDDDDDEEEDGAEETFSREVEEFELMDEHENQAAKKAEEQLRKMEDKEEKENKSALRTEMFGACTVCAEDEVTNPVGCIYCANFIGCRKCANRWYRTSKINNNDKEASCPLCRHKWAGAVAEVGDMLDLVKTA